MPKQNLNAGKLGILRIGFALPLVLLIAGVIYGLDQITKSLIVENLKPEVVYPVWGGLLQFQFVRNSGAAFSFATGMTWIFTILATVVIVILIWFSRRIHSKLWASTFGLLLGGVIGNLNDRLFREPGFGVGHVVDFISTPWMLPAIYNVADSAIVCSMALFLVLSFRGIRLDGSRGAAVPDSRADASG